MDAIAVTLPSSGRYVGVASLTDEQASQLAEIDRNPILATEANLAGRVAAERAFWILTPRSLDPLYAQLPEGSDPADILAGSGLRRRAVKDDHSVLCDIAANLFRGHTTLSLASESLPTAETTHAGGRRAEPRRICLGLCTTSELYATLLS
jgi:hypothetical protein